MLLSKDIRYMIQNIETLPEDDYDYPLSEVGKKQRKFRPDWQRQYSWLAYSPSDDGAYCLQCIAFAPSCGVGKGRSVATNKFVVEPYRNWKDMLDDCRIHSKADYHKDSTVRMQHFLKTVDQDEDIVDLLNEQSQRERQLRRNK